MELAIEIDRPVTIHCVRAYGELFKIIKAMNRDIINKDITNKDIMNKDISKQDVVNDGNGNPHLIMHSYGGSKEMTKSLMKLKNLNIFFSLSLRGSADLCSVIPVDRILCETDAPCQNNT